GLGGGRGSDTVGGAALRGEALPKKRCRMKRCGVRGSAVVGNAFLGLAVFGNAVLLSCAPATRYESPSTLRGYEILITRRDSLGQGLAEGLRRRGFTVRQHVRGGSRPTAYLLAFTFRETEPPELASILVGLGDTHSWSLVDTVITQMVSRR